MDCIFCGSGPGGGPLPRPLGCHKEFGPDLVYFVEVAQVEDHFQGLSDAGRNLGQVFYIL